MDIGDISLGPCLNHTERDLIKKKPWIFSTKIYGISQVVVVSVRNIMINDGGSAFWPHGAEIQGSCQATIKWEFLCSEKSSDQVI